jgi:poly(A) polymerase
MAEAICQRLRFSNDETEQILALVANHMKFGAVEEMRASTLKRFVRLPRFEEHLALHRLDCLSSHRHLESYNFVQRFLEVTSPEQVRPERLLNGDDLQAMGFKPGPVFSQILQTVEDAQLEGQLRTRQEAEAFVKEKFVLKGRRASSD